MVAGLLPPILCKLIQFKLRSMFGFCWVIRFLARVEQVNCNFILSNRESLNY